MMKKKKKQKKKKREERGGRGRRTRTEDPLAPLKPEIRAEENASMARRVPRAHTDAPVLGGRGTRTGSIFVGWRRRWRDKKPAASTLLIAVFLPPSSIPRFFPFVLTSLPRPPTAALFTPCASFFAATSLLPHSVLVVLVVLVRPSRSTVTTVPSGLLSLHPRRTLLN